LRNGVIAGRRRAGNHPLTRLGQLVDVVPDVSVLVDAVWSDEPVDVAALVSPEAEDPDELVGSVELDWPLAVD
jgi:hypothetical protein